MYNHIALNGYIMKYKYSYKIVASKHIILFQNSFVNLIT